MDLTPMPRGTRMDLTPMPKPIDLQSLRDTFEMKLTEMEFEGRFANHFHGFDLPSPLPKTSSSFVYPLSDRKSHKRRAPAPPMPQVKRELKTYFFKNINELGPILARSATLSPRTSNVSNVSVTVRVKMRSSTIEQKSKLKTFKSNPVQGSVLKANESSSCKLKNRGTFRNAIKRKHKSSVDLRLNDGPSFSRPIINPPPPSIDETNERTLDDTSTRRSPPIHQAPRRSKRGDPEGQESSCLNVASEEISISQREQEVLSLSKADISDASKSKNCIQVRICNNVETSSSSHVQGSPSHASGSSTYVQGSPNRINGSPSHVHGSPSHECVSPSRMHSRPSCVHSSPSQIHSHSHVHGNPSRVQGSPSRVQGSPSRVHGSPSLTQHSPSHVQGSSSHVQGSPSRVYDSSSPIHSPPRAHGSPSHTHGSPSHTHGSPSHTHGSPSHTHGSPSRSHGGPSMNAHGSPAHSSPSRAHNRLSHREKEPFCVQCSPSHVHGCLFCTQGSPRRVWDCSAAIQGNSHRKENTPVQIQNYCSPVRDAPTFMQDGPDWMQSVLSRITCGSEEMHSAVSQSETTGKVGYFPSYYNKQNSEHIYEDVNLNLALPDVQKSQKSMHSLPESSMQIGHHPPTVPSNSPVIVPKVAQHQTSECVNLNRDYLKKKIPPPKPLRNGKKGTSKPELEKGTVSTVPRLKMDDHNNATNSYRVNQQSPGKTQRKINFKVDGEKTEELDVTKKLEQYYFGDSSSKHTPEQPDIQLSTPKRYEKTPCRPALGLGPPGSRSLKKKTQKKTTLKKALTLSKTFRFSLMTSFGNFKLTGKKYFSNSHRDGSSTDPQNTQRGSFLSARSRPNSRSPTPRSASSFRIPRVVIDCEPAAGEDNVASPKVCKPKENNKHQQRCQSPVPSKTTPDTRMRHGYNLKIVDSPEELYTPRTTINDQIQCLDNDDEIEYIGSFVKSDENSNYRVPHQPSEQKSEVIYIKTVKSPLPRNSSLNSSPQSCNDEDESNSGIRSDCSPTSGDHLITKSRSASLRSPSKIQMISREPRNDPILKNYRTNDDLIAIINVE